jgi:hypothetical protein
MILRRFLTVFLFAQMIAQGGVAFGEEGATLLKHLKFLASDELRGRGNSQPELAVAAEYIAAQFSAYGLRPVGDAGTFFQSFEIVTGVDCGSESSVAFFSLPSLPVYLEQGVDYIPLSFGDGPVAGPLVFAGFGISAPELNYDDYGDLDVRGRVVVVFEHEPAENDENSPFSGADLTPYSTVASKVLTAKFYGAQAVVVIPDSFQHRRPKRALSDREPEAIEDLGLQAIQLSQDWGARLMALSNRSSREIRRWLNGHLTPLAFEFTGIQAGIALDIKKVRHTVRNVLGLLPGESDQILVVGAHYDHLGWGGRSSLSPDVGETIHNGADDNASGVAGLLYLADQLSAGRPFHSILFVSFAAEELGLLGSRYFVENSPYPIEDIEAMANLDMIGRSSGELLIGGAGTAEEFNRILEEVSENSPLTIRLAQTPGGSSDHLVFAFKKMPVLFFFSGLHEDYHRPSDDWQKINVDRTLLVLGVAREVIERIDHIQDGLHFVDLTNPGSLAPDGVAESGKAYFGSIPDMTYDKGGLRFADVLAGTPGAKAGLRAGDILMEFGGAKISNLYDFTYWLRKFSPGQRVETVVERSGKEHRVQVVLESWPEE